MFTQQITEGEAEMGFQRLCLEELFGGSAERSTKVVVARILSTSDVVVKILNPLGDIQYIHARWGRSREGENGLEGVRWHPINMMFTNAADFIQRFEFRGAEEEFPPGIIGAPFVYTVVEGS